MAANGRINVPADYLEYGSLKRNVLLIGMGRSIRIWDINEYNKGKMDKAAFAKRFKEKREKNKSEGK